MFRVCGIVHVKELLLLMRKSSPCNDDSRFRNLERDLNQVGLCLFKLLVDFS